MNIPTATYRIQFHSGFNFEAAQQIIPYLRSLGISHIYASPVFKARAGSKHGYDVVDPNQINPELGGEEGFRKLIQTLHQQGMGWIQDMVPNHTAYNSQNRYLMDVMESGPNSKYFDYFDITWDHPNPKLKGKILAPLLGKFYGECLENGEIQLVFSESGLSIQYYQLTLPLRIESYPKFFTYRLEQLGEEIGADHTHYVKYVGVMNAIKNLPGKESPDSRRDHIQQAKDALWELYDRNEMIRHFIERNLEMFNGKVGEPHSFDLLDNLLSQQYFRLAYWKVGTEEINYRRFFTVNELISLKMDNEHVFKDTHSLIFQLWREKHIDGVRIDHIDGLYDPNQYLKRLRNELDDAYIVVEKILEFNEELPPFWQIEGTSGYDFLNCVNGLFCQRENENQFDRIYYRFTGNRKALPPLVHEKKQLIAGKHLAGDIDNLAHILAAISDRYRHASDFTLYGLKRSLAELLSWFPVYRTYINEREFRESDAAYIKEAVEKAKAAVPDFAGELEFIKKILLRDAADLLRDEEKSQWIHSIKRFQQITGPLMAKGVEDTVFYVYNRFISLNEVGGNPGKFGISDIEFNYFNKNRSQQWRHSMNATATHDTKRGEDVRARLNVLSEIPLEWGRQVKLWSSINRRKKRQVRNESVPDKNDEYFLYQTLAGTFPFEGNSPGYLERIKEYVIKSVREAKVHTAWLQPDSEYEQGFLDFVEAILDESPDNDFLKEFIPFQKKIAEFGIYNSLSQTLIKMTAPGLPDFYQGTELWDFSLVDPDNRRPVDYGKRLEYLNDILQREQEHLLDFIHELLSSKENGKIKLFLIQRMLDVRGRFARLFNEGDYHSLEVKGKFRNHVIAFARNLENHWQITVAPRFLTGLIDEGEYPLGAQVWEDTRIVTPDSAPQWHHSITDQNIAGGNELLVGEILQHFPAGCLTGDPLHD